MLVVCVLNNILLCLLQNGNADPGSKSRIPKMVANTLGFGQKNDANVDIPLDSMKVRN